MYFYFFFFFSTKFNVLHPSHPSILDLMVTHTFEDRKYKMGEVTPGENVDIGLRRELKYKSKVHSSCYSIGASYTYFVNTM